MSTNLVLTGRYISYEIEKLSEKDATHIIKKGIDANDLSDLSFADGSEMGLIEGAVYQDQDIVRHLSAKDEKSKKIHKVPTGGWVIVREETGTISYLPLKTKKNFDEKLFRCNKYSDSINEYKIEYMSPDYDGKDFESDNQEVDTLSIFIISPQGDITFLTDTIDELREKAENAFNQGDIDSAIQYNGDALIKQILISSENDTLSLIIERQQAIFLMEADALNESEKFFLRNLKGWEITEGKESQGHLNTCRFYANMLMQMGRDKDAIKFHRMFLEKADDSFQRYKLGVALKNAGDFSNAKDELLKALKDTDRQDRLAMHIYKFLYEISKNVGDNKLVIDEHLKNATSLAKKFKDKDVSDYLRNIK